MAAGLGAESVAAKFRAGDGLEGYLGRWLLLEAADTATEDRLAKKHGILLLRAIVGEPLHMEDIKSSWFPGGKKGSNTNKQLLSGGLLVGGVKVFKADRTQCFGCKAKYVAFGSKPDAPVKEAYSIGSTASGGSCGSGASGAARGSPPPTSSSSSSPAPMKQKRNSVSSLSSDPAFHYYDDADSSGDEMGEVRGSSKQRVTRSEAKGSGEGGGVGLWRPRLVQRHWARLTAAPRIFFSARGGVAGHEQRGVEQHDSPRGQLQVGAVGGQLRPSGAADPPL